MVFVIICIETSVSPEAAHTYTRLCLFYSSDCIYYKIDDEPRRFRLLLSYPVAIIHIAISFLGNEIVMSPSTYLEEILSYNQSSETDRTLDQRSNEIFEQCETKSFVLIYLQNRDSNGSHSSSINPQNQKLILYVEVRPPRSVGPRFQKVSDSQELRTVSVR